MAILAQNAWDGDSAQTDCSVAIRHSGIRPASGRNCGSQTIALSLTEITAFPVNRFLKEGDRARAFLISNFGKKH